jgi:DNA-binding response OmpR family regulator
MLVLVVEDNPVNGAALTDSLCRRGYTSEWASNVDAALSKLLVFPADAAIVDLGLPGRFDGIYLLQEMRKQGIPTIVMTAAADEDPILSKVPSGVPLVRKPADLPEIIQVLDSLGIRPLHLYADRVEKLTTSSRKPKATSDNPPSGRSQG